ncbi:hypothetical protein BC936DRAFT_145517 [Jimgerdemannia flammicorona]|uniref:Uncharacterized protein n=1 Tax=Jimgerdemannia flammicorona TaxID=994334 RepID=A0A433D9T6_9FUNG|nr:hypothetical protein BC936DRAFT_145517 [Jimgerdemannia flammicorona]
MRQNNFGGHTTKDDTRAEGEDDEVLVAEDVGIGGPQPKVSSKPIDCHGDVLDDGDADEGLVLGAAGFVNAPEAEIWRESYTMQGNA